MGGNRIVPTKGQHSQPRFETIISDLKDDELEFLDQKYSKDLLYFRKNKNMNQKEYLKMQQRKKMIGEEQRNRRILKSSSTEPEIRFYSDEGTILDSDNNILETIAFNYNETEIITLPSGSKKDGKKPEWQPKVEDKENTKMSYTMMSDVELSWEDWCKKKCLVQ
jgi:hypothetical protein